MGFPGVSVDKESACNVEDCLQYSRLGSIPGWEDPLGKKMATYSSILTCEIPWTAPRQASLSFTISRSLLKLMSIESMTPSNHFILCSHLHGYMNRELPDVQAGFRKDSDAGKD